MISPIYIGNICIYIYISCSLYYGKIKAMFQTTSDRLPSVTILLSQIQEGDGNAFHHQNMAMSGIFPLTLPSGNLTQLWKITIL